MSKTSIEDNLSFVHECRMCIHSMQSIFYFDLCPWRNIFLHGSQRMKEKIVKKVMGEFNLETICLSFGYYYYSNIYKLQFI